MSGPVSPPAALRGRCYHPFPRWEVQGCWKQLWDSNPGFLAENHSLLFCLPANMEDPGLSVKERPFWQGLPQWSEADKLQRGTQGPPRGHAALGPDWEGFREIPVTQSSSRSLPPSVPLSGKSGSCHEIGLPVQRKTQGAASQRSPQVQDLPGGTPGWLRGLSICLWPPLSAFFSTYL